MFMLFGIPISALNLEESVQQVAAWANLEQTRTVTFCNAHVLALSTQDDAFRNELLKADLNCPDGKPLVWAGHLFESQRQLTQVAGPDFMPAFLLAPSTLGLRHYFYGTKDATLQKLISNLQRDIPNLNIAGYFSPPFAMISDIELATHCAVICEVQADIVWVSLGCPKQELWMQRAKGLLPGKVLIAVGQAFDLLAGETVRAPKFMRDCGLEWFYRLTKDPGRLWKRCIFYNSIFLGKLCTTYFHRTYKGS